MKRFKFPLTAKGKNLKELLYPAILVFVLVIAGYFIAANWQSLTERVSELPAGISLVLDEDEDEDEEITEEDLLADDLLPEPIVREGKYVEKAEKGEGMTHLARRALSRYLEQNPQDFEVTAEHKVYAEDYIVKKIGADWLDLGQEKEISIELIGQALESAKELSPEQLNNLTQYSQLVAF